MIPKSGYRFSEKIMRKAEGSCGLGVARPPQTNDTSTVPKPSKVAATVCPGFAKLRPV